MPAKSSVCHALWRAKKHSSCMLKPLEATACMGRMTDDAFISELPSVECVQQTQRTATTKKNKNQQYNPTAITNKEGLLKNKNETFIF